MKMRKNTIIAIVLTFLIIILWSIVQSRYFQGKALKPPAPEVKREQVPTKTTETKETKAAREEAQAPKAKKIIPKRDVFIETENYRAVLTSDGARLKAFKFKQYHDRVEESPITIKLTDLVDRVLGKKVGEQKKPELLDLVNTDEKEGFPLGLVIDSNPSLGSGNWEVDKDQLRLRSPGEKGIVSFSKTLNNGLRIVKRYGFRSGQDTLDLDVEIQNTTSKETSTQVGLEWIGKVQLKAYAERGDKDFGLSYAFMKGNKVEVKNLAGRSASGCTPGCAAKKTTIEPFDFIDRGDIKWFSFEGEYFAGLMIPPPPEEDMTLTVKGNERDLLKGDLTPPPVTLARGQTVRMPYRIYLGPKKVDELKALGVGAERLVNFGFFGVLGKPILWVINLTHSVTDNYGIDIIILSILIKIIFLPLTQISFKSMKEMQKLQPEMKRLQETYKNDKARLQQEVMLLYKRRKINPLSGCLPTLIQIPVFIALYNVLQNTFDMRHAPFFWWIRDLSAKDPILITPLIMGATMVIQQKMTPSSAELAQAKMMMLMPILFTFLFLNFPSGLVLYWLVNNALSIAHQHYLNKRL
jgi:YidC/Oxa1 family membrane protein insertase